MDTDFSSKMDLLASLIACGQQLSFWELTPSMDLIRSTNTNPLLYHSFLMMDESFPLLCAQNTLDRSRPVLYTNSIGLSWIFSAEFIGDSICRVYALGPAFISSISYISLEHSLSQKNYPKDLINTFMEHIKELPTVSLDVWMRYALMLQYCISGKRLEIFDLQHADLSTLNAFPQESDNAPSPKEATWYAEQMVMKAVEEGRLDYKSVLSELSAVGSAAVMSPGTSLRKMKNYMIAMNGLVTRAAIRGGLNIATTYHLGEIYLNAIEDAPTTAALMQISTTLFEDFVQRVHNVRLSPNISNSVQSCCSYIDQHLGEKLTMCTLASQVGYAEYYLAQKFKKEMGMTVSNYIRQRRVEQAKLLLRASNQTISAIADQLGFSNSSHFSDAFRSITGVTPTEFREGKLEL